MSRRLERIFTNPSDISRHLFCPICTDIFLDPTRLFCGHTFCKKCLTHWTKDHDTCPICRTEVHIDLANKDIVADKIIQDLEVRCTNRECTWTDRLENLEKHTKACVFTKKPQWLSQVNQYIEIDDEVPSNNSVPVQMNQNIARPAEKLNLFDKVFTMTQETRRMLENVISHGQLPPGVHNGASVRRESVQSERASFISIIEERKDVSRGRESYEGRQASGSKPDVIIIKKEGSSRKKDEIRKKEFKIQQDENAFFGLKPWLETNRDNNSTDDSVEIIMTSSWSNSKKNRRMRRSMRERAVAEADLAEKILKKKKVV